MTAILSIVKDESDTYSLVVRLADGSIYETICRSKRSQSKYGSWISAYTIDSKELNRRIMMGDLDARDIARAVERFRN